MQRLLKFATSPSTPHRGCSLNGNNRVSKSVDIDDHSGGASPPKDLEAKLKVLTFSIPPEQQVKNSKDLMVISSSTLSPPSPHPSVGSVSSGGGDSLLLSPTPISPAALSSDTAASSTSPSPSGQSSTGHTPTKSKRMAFFSSNRFSLDEFSPASKFGFRSSRGDTANNNHHHPEPTPPGSPPNSTSANNTTTGGYQHQRRAAVSSPIRLLHPKTGGGAGGGGGGGGGLNGLGSPSSHKAADFGDLEYMNTSNEGYRLTAEQRDLVRQAWRKSNSERGRNSAGTWIFKRIFVYDPFLKRLFNLHELEDDQLEENALFQKHAQVFTDVLEMVVDSTDALDDSMGPLLLSYGSKHVRFENDHGFRTEYWDAFGVAMTEYASNNWKFLKNNHRRTEALRAWRILVFFIVSKVKQGFTLERMALEKKSTVVVVNGHK